MRLRVSEATLDLFQASIQSAGNDGMFEHIKFEVFADDVANNEMVRGAFQATVLLSIGFVLLCGFVFWVVRRKLTGITGVFGAIIVTIASVLCPIFATLAAFGINTLLGNKICK